MYIAIFVYLYINEIQLSLNLQASFSSLSSFDFTSSQPNYHQQHQQLPHQQHQTNQQHQPQQPNLQQLQESQNFSYDSSSLDLLPDIIFTQSSYGSSDHAAANTSNADYARQSHHSNSSNETLIGGTSNLGSTENISVAGDISAIEPLQQFKQEYYTPGTDRRNETSANFVSNNTTSPADYFERSEDIGLLSLRSSSDPTIALHCFQSRQQALRGSETSANVTINSSDQSAAAAAAALLHSSLPSFQETYSIKYNQLSSLGLTMDDDCYNVASPHHQTAGSNYHHGHGHHPAAFSQEHFNEYQQQSGPFMNPNSGFYQYDQSSTTMVSVKNHISCMCKHLCGGLSDFNMNSTIGVHLLFKQV